MPIPRHGFGVGICTNTNTTTLVVFGGSRHPGVMNNPTPEPSTDFFSIGATDADSRWSMGPPMQWPRYGLLKGYGLVVVGRVYAVGGSEPKEGKLNPSDRVETLQCP